MQDNGSIAPTIPFAFSLGRHVVAPTRDVNLVAVIGFGDSTELNLDHDGPA